MLLALRDFKLCVQLAVAKTVCKRHTDRFAGMADLDLVFLVFGLVLADTGVVCLDFGLGYTDCNYGRLVCGLGCLDIDLGHPDTDLGTVWQSPLNPPKGD